MKTLKAISIAAALVSGSAHAMEGSSTIEVIDDLTLSVVGSVQEVEVTTNQFGAPEFSYSEPYKFGYLTDQNGNRLQVHFIEDDGKKDFRRMFLIESVEQ